MAIPFCCGKRGGVSQDIDGVESRISRHGIAAGTPEELDIQPLHPDLVAWGSPSTPPTKAERDRHGQRPRDIKRGARLENI